MSWGQIRGKRICLGSCIVKASPALLLSISLGSRAWQRWPQGRSSPSLVPVSPELSLLSLGCSTEQETLCLWVAWDGGENGSPKEKWEEDTHLLP